MKIDEREHHFPTPWLINYILNKFNQLSIFTKTMFKSCSLNTKDKPWNQFMVHVLHIQCSYLLFINNLLYPSLSQVFLLPSLVQHWLLSAQFPDEHLHTFGNVAVTESVRCRVTKFRKIILEFRTKKMVKWWKSTQTEGDGQTDRRTKDRQMW